MIDPYHRGLSDPRGRTEIMNRDDEPCWKSANGENCANCGKPWPQCMSEAGLRFLLANADMLTKNELSLLEAEFLVRGLTWELFKKRGSEMLNHVWIVSQSGEIGGNDYWSETLSVHASIAGAKAAAEKFARDIEAVGDKHPIEWSVWAAADPLLGEYFELTLSEHDERTISVDRSPVLP